MSFILPSVPVSVNEKNCCESMFSSSSSMLSKMFGSMPESAAAFDTMSEIEKNIFYIRKKAEKFIVMII